jgi:putative ABC transport system permease protein
VEVLKQAGRTLSPGRARHRALNVLVGTQVALALILLIGAGLLIRSFIRLQQVHPGFEANRVLAVTLERSDIPKNRVLGQRISFYQQLVERISALPGVEYAGVINLHPITPDNSSDRFDIKGQTFPTNRKPRAEYRQISPDYFQCMQIPLIRGRWFTTEDYGQGTHVMIVNQELVRRYFPDTDPIGQILYFHGQEKRIVGVVGDVKQTSLSRSRMRSFMYEPITQACNLEMSLMVRSSGDLLGLIRPIQQQIWDIDSTQPILWADTMDHLIANSLSVERFCVVLLVVMAAVALLMAVVGLYSVMAHTVYERTSEIGIRMAIGAQRGDILKLICKNGLILTIIGLFIGLTGAFILTRCMSSMLYQISITDPVIFIIVPLILIAIAMLACYLPARRAAKVDPMEALRYE